MGPEVLIAILACWINVVERVAGHYDTLNWATAVCGLHPGFAQYKASGRLQYPNPSPKRLVDLMVTRSVSEGLFVPHLPACCFNTFPNAFRLTVSR
ncbi:MAG: hypothetical protein WCK15_18085, partial [Pirellula sp.]